MRRFITALCVLSGMALAASSGHSQNASPVVVIVGVNGATAVTTSDTTTYPTPNHGVYNGGAAACDIALKLANDTTAVTFKNVPSGATISANVLSVMATNTVCANIVLLK